MLLPAAGGPLGLIAIESPRASAAAQRVAGGDDATLEQLFERLSGCRSRPVTRRFCGRSYGPASGAQVAADCHTLRAQLERAARRLRRKLAAASGR